MKNRYAVSLAVAASLAVSLAFAPEVVAQTGTPGTKQMQDTQRKAEQKAHSTGKKSHHKNTNQKAAPQKAGSAGLASAP
ncbi:hypothetical protein [Paraburkholderia sediminicola]|uniref:hypothetical protein n=1 Tax=Paraburkholderia sediminicola TaxID=458836 RepID=UPI0038BA3205